MSDEINILRHALGYRDDDSGNEYRNYYAADPSNNECAVLAEKGDMEALYTSINGLTDHLIYYRVTPQGKRRVMEAMPPVGKMSASKRRYQKYLDVDTEMPFGSWLKSQAQKKRREKE